MSTNGRKIVVTSKFGKPVISTSGYDGDGCLQATAGIERVLSGEGGVDVREFTPGIGVEDTNLETN
jgi:hypothetical protein